jgi:hypothetical protein
MFEISPDNLTKNREGYLFAYAQIAFNQLRRFALLQDPQPEASGFRRFTQDFEVKAEILETRILCAITTALFLEAYIFDYCARKRSASFALNYLDKLDTPSKWIITTQLLCPPGIDPGSEVFSKIKRIFTLRNSLVHHKTKEGESFSESPAFPEDCDPQYCIKAIGDTLQELQRLDPSDQFAEFVLRHLGSWFNYSAKDSAFYPILWEA